MQKSAYVNNWQIEACHVQSEKHEHYNSGNKNHRNKIKSQGNKNFTRPAIIKHQKPNNTLEILRIKKFS